MRIRMTLTIVREYEPQPEHYPPDKQTPEGMLEVDLESANDDWLLFFAEEESGFKVVGEIVA